MLNTYLPQFDPDVLDEQEAFAEAERASAERSADTWISMMTDCLAIELDTADVSDLYDKTLWVKVFGRQLSVADAAMLAACLPPEQRDVVLADVRRELHEFFVRRELEG